MRIEYARQFVKMYSRVPRTVQNAFDERITLFLKSPYHPLLNNHRLSGRYLRFHSINVTGDWRAIFEESRKREVATFLLIGTHSQLYG